MARFVVAASCLAVLVGSSCGPNVPVPDAGRVTGGGLAGTGGGAAGGSSGGGSATGGGSAGGSAGGSSTGCVALPGVTFQGMAGSAGTSFPADGGVVGLSIAVISSSSPYALFETYFFNRTPATPLALPVVGTFETISNTTPAFALGYVSLNCSNMGENCQQVFASNRGNYSITAATMVADAGMFNGAITTTRLVEVNPVSFERIPDGGCLDLAAFTFTSSWP